EVQPPAVVKAQLLEGGRGKRGGIRFAETAAEVERAAAELLAGSPGLPAAAAVLVEEKVEVERELYLAFMVDGRLPSGAGLLALARGGVDVEKDAAGSRPLPLPVLERRLPASVVRDTAAALGLPPGGALGPLLDACLRLFREQDCLLLEINPLGVLGDGRLVALDARIELDDAA